MNLYAVKKIHPVSRVKMLKRIKFKETVKFHFRKCSTLYDPASQFRPRTHPSYGAWQHKMGPANSQLSQLYQLDIWLTNTNTELHLPILILTTQTKKLTSNRQHKIRPANSQLSQLYQLDIWLANTNTKLHPPALILT